MRRRSFAPAAAMLLAVALMSCDVAESLSPTSTNVPLTPARSIVGHWTTTAPVAVNYQTDFCPGGKKVIATATWNVTWDVTAVEGFSNVVDIEMRLTRSATTPTAGGCGGASGWVPVVSPTFFRGSLSSSEFGAADTRQGLNVFGPYTTSSLTVTWVHYECLIYCFGEFTATNALKLVKQ